jgi:hypothetical protein
MNMKKSLTVLSLVAFTTLSFAGNGADEPNPVVKEGIKYIKMLGKGLKSEVKKRMEEDSSGAKAAEFCANNAKEVAKKVSANFPEGVVVRRTSLKYRNPDNKPDKVDVEVMKGFLDGKLKPKPTLVKVQDKNRVYVPLIIDNVCLKCHGDPKKMDKKVQEIISKKYPEDRATGYKLNDLRGVIVAELPLPKKETEAK